ncbi:hypothetical protein XELAEV_18041491mg [Xenopus laevis]|uniref:Uncharacterized protein n=1 Tax=Xenopus laevis TaxID=8355 RepID=A0A974H5J7_XENLA|nr:hypothetical protein XELAEV_18041491mg [Xenopus laevis]
MFSKRNSQTHTVGTMMPVTVNVYEVYSIAGSCLVSHCTEKLYGRRGCAFIREPHAFCPCLISSACSLFQITMDNRCEHSLPASLDSHPWHSSSE